MKEDDYLKAISLQKQIGTFEKELKTWDNEGHAQILKFPTLLHVEIINDFKETAIDYLTEQIEKLEKEFKQL